MASTGDDSLPSCLNDPNFAVICAFLQKFATKLNVVYPNFSDLQKMIENTDEVAEDLKNLIVKLLRKTRKTVHNEKWEHALAKFCYSYSSQDAWEIERFGFKKANLSVKLRVIKEVLESQFERNLKFKTELNLLSAEELRSQPLGKDKLGNAYWSTMDVDLNLRIYQEHLDEDIWKICAHSRDELAKLIACLKGNELVMPSLVGLVDEDSNSQPQEKLDALKNGDIDSDEQNKDPTKPAAEKVKAADKVEDEEDLSDEENESNISEMDVSSQDASECSTSVTDTKIKAPVVEKLPPIVVSKNGTNKNTSKKESSSSKLPAKKRLESESGDESASKVPKLQRPTLLSKNKTIKTNKFAHLEDDRDDDDEEDDSEEEEEEEEEEEQDEEDGSGSEDETDDEDVGEEIEEPVMHVKGLGSGAANEGTFLDLMNLNEESDVGEAIEEDVIYIVGNGSGAENQVGNPENKPSSDKKPMFFFGQAGCLKLSPIKTNLQKLDNNLDSSLKASNLFPDVSTIADGGQSSTTQTDLDRTNSTTETELPVNSQSAEIAEELTEKTNENDDDLAINTQESTIESDVSPENDTVSELIKSEGSENQNSTVVVPEIKDSNDEKVEPIVPTSSENQEPVDIEQLVSEKEGPALDELQKMDHQPTTVDNSTTETVEPAVVETENSPPDAGPTINDSTCSENVASSADIPSTTCIDDSVSPNAETPTDKSIENHEVLPATVQHNTTSHEDHDLSETSSEQPICPEETVEMDKPTISEGIDEPEPLLSTTSDTMQPSGDAETLNVVPSEFVNSNDNAKDIDTVPESKTENIIKSDCAVKSDETSTVSNDVLVCESETTSNVEDNRVESSPIEEPNSGDKLTVEESVSAPQTPDNLIKEELKIASAPTEVVDVLASTEVKDVSGSTEVKDVSVTTEVKDVSATTEVKNVLASTDVEDVLATTEVKDVPATTELNACTIASVNETSSTAEVKEISNTSEIGTSDNTAEDEAATKDTTTSFTNPPETYSCDSKVESLVIDSGSCSEYLSPSALEMVSKDKEIHTNQSDTAPILSPSKELEYEQQTSQSNTEAEDTQSNTPAPENFSSLNVTDQSDEIASEPVIDHLTTDVTSISTPSFDDQDNRTNDSLLNDVRDPIEAPPDISSKEIGKFQIFNRKVEDNSLNVMPERSDEPPKLQYEGSEETKTPLVIAQPVMSEVPPIVNTPVSMDSIKESKSNEAATTTSSSLMQDTSDKVELTNPTQVNPSIGEVVNSKQEPLTQFPISFKNTQINNRKRPLISKNDDDTDESSSEASTDEVEVKRQKTKPKFSHLAARKNAEIKRKATQIDCSTDEDEPVNKVQLKIVSTELSKIENTAKQKKMAIDKSPLTFEEDDDSVVDSKQRTQNVHNELPIAEKLEPICLTTSKTVPVEERTASAMTEKNFVPEGVNAIAIVETPSVSNALTKSFDERNEIPMDIDVSKESEELTQAQQEMKTEAELPEVKPTKVVETLEEVKADLKPTVENVKLEVRDEKAVKDNSNIQSVTTDVKPACSVKTIAESESKAEAKSNEIATKQETTAKQEVQKPAETKSEPKLEDNVETVGSKKADTTAEEQMKTSEKPEMTKVETRPSKPGPKSKKPGFVPANAVVNVAETSLSAPVDISKDDTVVGKVQPETVQTTTRSRTTRAVAASQPTTDLIVPEPIQKPTPKATATPATKPAPSKSTTVQPKKTAKAKPPPKPKAPKKQAATPAPKKESKPASTETPATKKETPRKRTLMGLTVDDNAILSTNDGETPVRQSRRIAQIKIKEEAERRKEEELALKQMKAAASEKKKKVVDETYTVKSESEASEDDSEQKLEMKKKNKKKVKGGNPWQTDSDHDESDVSEEEHYESDHKLIFDKSDHEFSPESDIDESQIVQTKRARTAQKDDEDEIIDDGYACQKCNKHDHPEWILLCDKCDKGYHCSCLVPMLFIIPEGDWFCPLCQQDKLIETLENQLQNLDKEIKVKELEEINRQRAAFTSISVANVVPDEPDDEETEYQKPKSARKRPTTNRRRRRNDAVNRSSSGSNESSSSSESSRSGKSGSSSSATNSSDDEPIYKLRKRRQANVSYRFNEYDDLINSAIKKEMDSAEGAGNLGRGKDISTIIEADKEEKRIKQMEEDDDDDENEDNAKEQDTKLEDENKTKSESNAKASDDSDSEPIRKTLKRPLSKKTKKKHRKLNSLDIESEDDGSDDDFRTSSFSEDEEDENFSAESESDSSLDMYRGKKNKKHETRRSVRSRRKRYDDAFINDSDGDDLDEPKVTRKKKKQKIEDSDFSDDNESTDEDAEEDVDSEDLCDSTDSNESDRGWRSKKTKKAKPKKPATVNSSVSKPAPKKKVKKVEDTAFRAGIPKSKGKSISDESDDEDVQTKSRRTRGKKLTYLNLLDEFESSDSDGIKPGVKRPDTPPEERAAFIKKQEEIKRMLAEKNTEAAAALAAPKLTGSTPEKIRRPPAGTVDSLSTIPRSIIQNAKALDPDYKKGKDSDDTDGFDDDLPDDFDAEGMDEEEIAKMMEEEDFAQQQLKAVGERVRKMKEAELLLNKKKEAAKVSEPSVITPTVPVTVTVAPVAPAPVNIPAHLTTPPSLVVSPSSFSPRPSMPMPHIIRPPHSSPLSPGNVVQHMQPHPVHHPQHSPHGSQHLQMHPHMPPHGPHAQHLITSLNQPHPSHQMVRGPPHHLLHPSQHPMQHFNPLQRHPMQLTQPPHISPNSQQAHMPHRPMHPSIRSHHPLQMHPPQMQSHPPPPMVVDYPGDSKMMKLTKSGVEPKKRGRKSKAELQAIEQAKGIAAPDPSTSMASSLLQHPTHAPGPEPIIPTTVLAVQNTRLVDPSELGPPGAGAGEVKKRGRRKKFTPLRETLNKSAAEPPSGLEPKTNPILAERLGMQDIRSNLSIATPPQLFSPGTVSQPSVITRLPRPPLGSPYGPGGPAQQRFYPPQPGQPPVSIAQSTRLPFSPHGPPPPLTSSPATSSNGGPPTNHYVQSEQMSRQPTPHSGHFRSPAPAHFSGPPSSYQSAPGMPALIHRSGLQPIEGASSTPQDYSTPSVPIPYAASYGTYYPPHHSAEHRAQQPPPPTTAPSAVVPATSSFEQFDNAKNTPPHDRATPNAYQSPSTEEPATSTSEFSGLVSYFSSQQDDLES